MPDKRDPFRELDEFLERMNEQFGGIGRSFDTGIRSDIRVDVADHGEDIVVTADLPGFDRDDIEVRLDNGTLVIDAVSEVSDESEEEDDGITYHRRERQQRSVSRRLGLPTEVVGEDTAAAYDNGVLTVTLPKQAPEAASGKRIDIE